MIVARRGDLNYRVRQEEGKMLCVYHNGLKPCAVPSSRASVSNPTAGGPTDTVSWMQDTERSSQTAAVSEAVAAVPPPVAERGAFCHTVPGQWPEGGERAIPSEDAPEVVTAESSPAAQGAGRSALF